MTTTAPAAPAEILALGVELAADVQATADHIFQVLDTRGRAAAESCLKHHLLEAHLLSLEALHVLAAVTVGDPGDDVDAVTDATPTDAPARPRVVDLVALVGVPAQDPAPAAQETPC